MKYILSHRTRYWPPGIHTGVNGITYEDFMSVISNRASLVTYQEEPFSWSISLPQIHISNFIAQAGPMLVGPCSVYKRRMINDHGSAFVITNELHEPPFDLSVTRPDVIYTYILKGDDEIIFDIVMLGIL
jgi:hypothetical protein